MTRQGASILLSRRRLSLARNTFASPSFQRVLCSDSLAQSTGPVARAVVYTGITMLRRVLVTFLLPAAMIIMSIIPRSLGFLVTCRPAADIAGPGGARRKQQQRTDH